MIHHAWSVLCERSSIDKETNNITLSAIEKVNGKVLLTKDDAENIQEQRIILPLSVELVSLWYNDEPGTPQKAETTIELIGPGDERIGSTTIPVDTDRRNHRTRSKLDELPTNGSGAYFFLVTLSQNGATKEVARIPLEVNMDIETTKAGVDDSTERAGDIDDTLV